MILNSTRTQWQRAFTTKPSLSQQFWSVIIVICDLIVIIVIVSIIAIITIICLFAILVRLVISLFTNSVIPL